MTPYIQSAIIGFWRQGATVKAISIILEVREFDAAITIADYFKNKKLW